MHCTKHFLCQSHLSYFSLDQFTFSFNARHIYFMQFVLSTASVVSSKMNFSVNPCDDFYQFACGRFEKTSIIPDDAGSVNTINMIEGRVMAQLHTLLNSEINENEIRPFKMAKLMFRQCMNTGKFNAMQFSTSLSHEN